VSAVSGQERLARAALSFLAEPGDPVLGALLRCWGPAEIVAAVSASGDARATPLQPGAASPVWNVLSSGGGRGLARSRPRRG